MLIDETFFVGENIIPNTDKTYVLERLTALIEKKEPELLQDILGYELYKAFSADTEDYDGDASNGTIPQRWMDIIEGVEYTYNSKVRKWKGLIRDFDTTPRSLIADYVYFYWLRDNTTQTTGVGEAVAKAENAIVTSAANKMVRAWNEMSEQIYLLYDFLQASKTTYPEWESQYKYCMLQRFRPINTFGI